MQTNGLSGMNVRCFAANGSTLFAGTMGDGLYVSTDAGANWALATPSLPKEFILALAVNGTNIFKAAGPKGMFLSTDNGVSWTSVNSGLPPVGTNVFAVIANGANLFAGTGGGFFLSTDNGASWVAANDGLSVLSIWSLALNGNTVLAGTEGGGLYASTDNGTLWSSVGLPGPTVTSILVHEGKVFAASYGAGIFLSTDNGTNWEEMNTGLTNLSVQSIKASGPDLFAGTNGGGGIFHSTDDGKSWTSVSIGLTNKSVRDFLVSDGYLLAGTMDGIWRRPLSEFGASSVSEDDALSNAITISPNPTTGIVTIRNEAQDAVGVTVANMLGERVLEMTQSASDFTFDLSRFPAGAYVVKLVTAGRATSKMLIKE